MYEIGRFAVIGENEPQPVGYLPIRLLPFSHYASFVWWDATTRAMLEALPELVKPGDRVLDFGCGASAILSLAAVALGATPYPVEIHPEIAEIAQRQLAANGQTMLVVPEALPAAAPYDVVLANVGDDALVAEVRRLAPHGLGTGKDGTLIRW